MQERVHETNCTYLHDEEKGNSTSEFKCVGCHSAQKHGKYVIEHMINDIKTFFCLNCEDWIQCKERVYEPGWSLFDEHGYLRRDI